MPAFYKNLNANVFGRLLRLCPSRHTEIIRSFHSVGVALQAVSILLHSIYTLAIQIKNPNLGTSEDDKPHQPTK